MPEEPAVSAVAAPTGESEACNLISPKAAPAAPPTGADDRSDASQPSVPFSTDSRVPLTGSAPPPAAAAAAPGPSGMCFTLIVVAVVLVAFAAGTAVSQFAGPWLNKEAPQLSQGAAFLGSEVKGGVEAVEHVFVHGEVNTSTTTVTSVTRTQTSSSTMTFTETTRTTTTASDTTSTGTRTSSTTGTFTTRTTTWTGSYPADSPRGYSCLSDQFLGPVNKPTKKGFALDDTTFSKCPYLLADKWPNAEENVSSIRLFKAWDVHWTANRMEAWIQLRSYVQRQNVKVLYGTQITCNETADDLDWAYVKELMLFIGYEHVMGLAIGNEIELLHTQKNVSDKCIDDMFDGGYFYTKVMHRANDLGNLQIMPGFQDVRLTTVMGGFVLGDEPFVNTREARVLNFFTKISADFGQRWAWSWNTYPYFDPHITMDEGLFPTCSHAMMAAINFASSSMLPSQLRVLRTRVQQVTGRPDDTFWLTETGWSYPRATTLSTAMKNCAEWSTVEALALYYQNFLDWDLGLGPNVHGVDHAFYFTLRDSINFGDKENFGLIRGCESRGCKLRHNN